MADKQDNGDMHINGITFVQVSSDNDYVLYQAQESRKLGDIATNIFLEHVSGKGWWGVVRLNGGFRIQLSLDRKILFPTPEIALLATEEFLTDEPQVRETLEDMHKNKLDLETFHHMPPRPPDVDPEKYFSPALLEVNGNIFTLYHLTNTEAAYRSWGYRGAAEIAVGLCLAHIYWKGWQAALCFPGFPAAMFEPAIDQLFLTPEKALETLLAFCSEEDSMHDLLQRLRETNQQNQIMGRRESVPLVTAKPPLRVNNVDFVWQKQISEGDLYQAKRANFVRFKKVYVQLVETWHKGWLGGLQFQDISGVYFEKEVDVGFSTPEEAFDVAHAYIVERDGLQILRDLHSRRIFLQCKVGRYDQLISFRTIEQKHGH